LDATTGEFERLKEFGIKASKSGDQVSLSFKGLNQTIANTPEAIQAALLAFGDLEGVAGGMAAISGTLEGRLSNLDDASTSLSKTVGDILAPTIKSLVNIAIIAIEATTKWIKENPKLAKTLLAVGAAVVVGVTAFTSIQAILTILPSLAAAAGRAMAFAFGPAGLAFAAVAALVAMIAMAADRIDRLNTQRVEATSEKLLNLTEKQRKAALLQLDALSLADTRVKKGSEGYKNYEKALRSVGLTMEDVSRKVKVRAGEMFIVDADSIRKIRASVAAAEQASKPKGGAGFSSKALVEEIKNTMKELKQATDEIVALPTNEFSNFGKNVGKIFGSTIPVGLEKAMFVAGEIANAGLQLLQAQFAAAAQKIQNKLQKLNLFSQVFTAKEQERNAQILADFEKQQDDELNAFKAKQDEMVRIEKEAANSRLEAITNEYLQRKELQDSEFASKKAQLEEEYRLRLETERLSYEAKRVTLEQESADKAQAQIAEQLLAEDWKNYQVFLQEQLNGELVNLATQNTETTQLLKEEENKAKEAEQKASDDKLVALEKAKAQAIAQAEIDKENRIIAKKEEIKEKEKKQNKALALAKYGLDLAALQVNKQMQRAQAATAFASGLMSVAQTIASMTAATAGFGLPAALAIGGTLTAILGTALSTSLSTISSQTIAPPAELFLARGGVVPGRATGDIVPARLTPGEMVVDRSTTQGLQAMVEQDRMGKMGGVTINFMSGSIQNSGSMDERSMDMLSNVIVRRLEREYQR
jgi:hypothetical protein